MQVNENKRYKVGITFGAFDPLHYGHIRLIQRAADRCDELIVAVSTSEYIEKHKGHAERFPYFQRLAGIQSIKDVTKVIPQDDHENTKEKSVKKHKAEVIFVGDNWTPATFTGEGLDVPVVYLEHTKGISSTQLVNGEKA